VCECATAAVAAQLDSVYAFLIARETQNSSGMSSKSRAVCGRMSEGGHLHPGATLLANVVAVHDVEDFIPDGLGIAATAHTPQHVTHPLLSGTACPPMSLCAPT